MLRPHKPKKSTRETKISSFILHVSWIDDNKRDRQMKAESDVNLPDEIKYANGVSRRKQTAWTDEPV